MTDQSGFVATADVQDLQEELAPGTPLCSGQYVIDRYLNSGGFGITYLARDSLDRKVVIKECFPNALCGRLGHRVHLRSRSCAEDFGRAVEFFGKEATALARLNHPNIVGVHQIFHENNTAYMALDFIRGADLLDVLEQQPDRLTPGFVDALLRSLLRALGYTHREGILHRDISPDNILLEDTGEPVLIDFGAARQNATKASRILSSVFTVKDGYSPQEFYLHGIGQTRASDLYALAATFVHLITGAPPPNSSLRLAAMAENRPDPFQPLLGRVDGYDPSLLSTIDRCMALFQQDRLQTAEDWLIALDAPPETPRFPRNPLQMLGVPAHPAEPEPPGVLDGEVGRTIASLVAENHAALAQDPAPTKPDQPEPDPTVLRDMERRAAEREYWAILNEAPPEAPSESDETPVCVDAESDAQPVKRSRLASLLRFRWFAPSNRTADPSVKV